MDWFQPTAGSVTQLSIACIDLVFLIYLLRLKRKTKDCYLIIFIFLTFLPCELGVVVTDASANPPFAVFCVIEFFTVLHILSVIWCSYRFSKKIFPRECVVVIIVYFLLLVTSSFLYLKDAYLYQRVSLIHILYEHIVYGAAVTQSGINYLRRIKIFSNENTAFSLINELRYPSTREIAVSRGFAFSLLIYMITELITILFWLQIIPITLFFSLIYLLSASITILVAFVYFNYAREQTSFETKLVGITLFVTLCVISIIPLILFGSNGTAETEKYIKAFVLIVPVSTILICFLLPLLFRLTILTHLNNIVAGVQLVISGDLSAKVDIEVNDEIGRLSHNFNKMTRSLRQRTEQLNSMRETIATDFHDQTGNMLSAITRQAGLLKLKLSEQHELQPIVESIVANSNSLYASSKDFLWQLNHNTDDPNELFDYLTAYGQLYYNQFDIAYSATAKDCRLTQFEPSAVLNLIFIFKEAMTNVVKHAGATEVHLTMYGEPSQIIYALEDNGSWKEADQTREHYGMTNMERRCKKNGFGFSISKLPLGTKISITVPVKDPTYQL